MKTISTPQRHDIRLDYCAGTWALYVRSGADRPIRRWEPPGRTSSARTVLTLWSALLTVESFVVEVRNG